MKLKNLHARPLLALVLTLLFAAPAFAGGCSDRFLVMFSARPAGAPIWISPLEPFTVTLPSELEATGGSIHINLHLKRVSDATVVAEFGLTTDTVKHAALYALGVDKSEPDALIRAVTDENGNDWGIQLYPACPRTI